MLVVQLWLLAALWQPVKKAWCTTCAALDKALPIIKKKAPHKPTHHLLNTALYTYKKKRVRLRTAALYAHVLKTTNN